MGSGRWWQIRCGFETLSVFFPRGRVAMLATMGYIVPEYFRFPGAILGRVDLRWSGGLKSMGYPYIIHLNSIVHLPSILIRFRDPHLYPFVETSNYVVLWMEVLFWRLPKQDTALPRRGWNLLTSPMDLRPSARCVDHQRSCLVLFALQTMETELSVELPVAWEIGSFRSKKIVDHCDDCYFSNLTHPYFAKIYYYIILNHIISCYVHIYIYTHIHARMN